MHSLESLNKMPFTLSPVGLTDVEHLIRQCEFPANRDDPLRLVMFPSSDATTQDEEMWWDIECLKRTVDENTMYLRKICLEDGSPVGFAGWSLECPFPVRPHIAVGYETKRTDGQGKPRNWHPSHLDIDSWLQLSALFRKEKKRVLQDRTNIWRELTRCSSLV